MYSFSKITSSSETNTTSSSPTKKIPVGQNAVCQKISGNIQFSAVLIGRLLEFILVQLLVMLQLLFSPAYIDRNFRKSNTR